ncbi:hypothetical protein EVA_09018 [gut metagenome]|uniref:Uncharacterized protein n=1 Tax=gut metagenome TaxID=749906 RepID=J9G6K4_9ZZZZ
MFLVLLCCYGFCLLTDFKSLLVHTSMKKAKQFKFNPFLSLSMHYGFH